MYVRTLESYDGYIDHEQEKKKSLLMADLAHR
jgi:hypothetical protein